MVSAAVIDDFRKMVDQLGEMYERADTNAWPEGQDEAVDEIGELMKHSTNERCRKRMMRWQRGWMAWLVRNKGRRV